MDRLSRIQSLSPIPAIVPNAAPSTAKADEPCDSWEDDPANPLNWCTRKKWIGALVVSITGFMSTMGSSMPAPASSDISKHYANDNPKVGVLITSAYVLGLGLGPFVYAPLAELYGRTSSYTLSTIPFAALNASCMLAPNLPSLIVLRLFCGFFGSSGPSLGVATVSDMFSPAERGTPISIYAIGPMAGPVFGSILGGYVRLAGWRWIFGTLAIISLINAGLVSFFLRESYAPVVKYRLAHQRKALASSGSPSPLSRNGWIRSLMRDSDHKVVFKKAFTRPPRLLFGNPVQLFFSLYYAFIYAIIYVIIILLPSLYSAESENGLFNYGWPARTAPLAYLGLGLGFFTAAFIASNSQDKIYGYLSRRNGDNGQPEYRLILCQIGLFFFPLGWLIFGWTAHFQTAWIAPEIGLSLAGVGLMLSFNSIQTFIVDYSSPYSAAGIAGATFARSIVAFILPIYASDLFVRLGWGWGGTLFAALSLVAFPAPILLFRYGKGLRERFKFVD